MGRGGLAIEVRKRTARIPELSTKSLIQMPALPGKSYLVDIGFVSRKLTFAAPVDPPPLLDGPAAAPQNPRLAGA
jgi:hypothetical protein